MTKPPTRRQHNSTLPERTAPLARSGRPARGPRTPVKARNPKRRAKEWLRAYGSEERVEWIQAQPSVVSGLGPCENVHVRGGGGSRKADARWIVPMTAEEHRELHQMGKASFEDQHGVCLDAAAERTERAWIRHSSGLVHVGAIVPTVLRQAMKRVTQEDE